MTNASMPQRYNTIAIILHWLMAIGFFALLGCGLVMANLETLEKSFKFELFQLHKSGGVIMLIAIVLRILWRGYSKMKHQVPAIPETFAKTEITLAKLGHIALYGLMIGLPLSGWALVSSSSYGLPTIVFGAFEWPHIPNISGNHDIHEIAETAHLIFAYALIATLIAHIGAVIKHAIKDNENLLTRMWWN